MVRAERIELSSFAWKADILAIIRRPHQGYIIPELLSKLVGDVTGNDSDGVARLN